MQILLPKTDNCPSWISDRERMTLENILWWTSPRKNVADLTGVKPAICPDHQSDVHPIEPWRLAKMNWCFTFFQHNKSHIKMTEWWYLGLGNQGKKVNQLSVLLFKSISEDLVIIFFWLTVWACYTLPYVCRPTGLSKQCRPRWDATECSLSSRSTHSHPPTFRHSIGK